MLLNNQKVTEKNQRGSQYVMKTQQTKTYEKQQKQFQEGSYTSLPQEMSKTLNNLTLHLKQPEKEQNPKVSRRKEIIKIRAKIKVKEVKKTIAEINKTKS